MKSLLPKFISIFILPGALAVQVISNLFKKVTQQQPPYQFKTQCIHKRIGKYESDIISIKKNQVSQETVPMDIQNHKNGETNLNRNYQGSFSDIIEGSLNNVHPTEKHPEIIIVLIPGNPGYVRFYDLFLYELATKLNFAHNIYAICHAGHLGVPDSKRSQGGQGDNPFGQTDDVLNEQFEHKVAFLEHVMKEHPGTQLVLLGHSIGALFSLQLMEIFPILHSYLLFPTIEKMNDVPNYAHSYFFTCLPIRWILAAAVELLRLMPKSIKRLILRTYLQSKNKEEDVLENEVQVILAFLDSMTIVNFARMAQSEFTQVRQRPDYLIAKHGQNATFYYSHTDKWAPLKLFNRLKRDFPKLDANLDVAGIHHGFVIGGARKMANLLSQWIIDLKNKKHKS